MKTLGLSTILLMFVVLLGGGTIVYSYNGIVDADKRADEEKAQIEVVCQRRLDLIPNLIETVKAYAKHEQQTLEAITAKRVEAVNALVAIHGKKRPTSQELAKVDSSQSDLTKAATALFLAVENYPDLKASMNFLALQDQFEGTENRIAVARERFNAAAGDYNARINRFPGIIAAALFGYGERDFFEAKPEALEGVKANF